MQVLNWDLLGPDYLKLDGIETFVPTDVQTVPSTTSLVAARENTVSEEFSAEFSEAGTPDFHYFLSGNFSKCVCARARTSKLCASWLATHDN